MTEERGDLIEVGALRLRCRIGCSDEERREDSDVVIDLTLATDARPAGESDELAHAWNYRTPVKAVVALVDGLEIRTVEALATRIARILVVEYGCPWARVKVLKPGALRFADTVGITIVRTPADFTPGQVSR